MIKAFTAKIDALDWIPDWSANSSNLDHEGRLAGEGICLDGWCESRCAKHGPEMHSRMRRVDVSTNHVPS